MNWLIAAILLAAACGGDRTAPELVVGSQPDQPGGRDSARVPSNPPGLYGVVTDDDRRPVANAAIVLGTWLSTAPSAFSDSLGVYTVPLYRLSSCLDPAAYASAEKDGYEPDSRCVMKFPQNFHLYRIRRITAGDSTSLAVSPDDMTCFDDAYYAPLNQQWVCRWVRIVVPKAGVVTVDVTSTLGPTGGSGGLWLFWTAPGNVGGESCCDVHTSLQVPAGVEAVAAVMIRANIAGPQSFVVKTSVSDSR